MEVGKWEDLPISGDRGEGDFVAGDVDPMDISGDRGEGDFVAGDVDPMDRTHGKLASHPPPANLHFPTSIFLPKL